MHQFSVSVGKLNLLQLVFVEDLNVWMRATHKYQENWVTTSSNDSIASFTDEKLSASSDRLNL